MEQEFSSLSDKLDASDAETLHIKGRYIHSDSVGSPALYKLSDSLKWLRDTLKAVQLYTLDRVESAGPTTPAQHLCTLRHPTAAGSKEFRFFSDSDSDKGSYSVNLGAFRPNQPSRRHGHRVHRLSAGLNGRLETGELLFTAVPSQERKECYEWTDESGIVAREIPDPDSGLGKLVIMADITQQTQHELVISWVLRLWWDSVQNPGKFADDCKYANYKPDFIHLVI